MKYFFKNVIRKGALAWKYPKAFLGSVILKAKLKPFVLIKSQRHGDITAKKSEMIDAENSLGWAMNDKIIEGIFFGLKLFELRLEEGEVLTAEHFFFSRSHKDFIDALSMLNEQGVEIMPDEGTRVYEPGCGAGRYLAYMEDRYGVRATGRDIYAPAIAVAKNADVFQTMDFGVEDVVAEGALKKYADGFFDLVYVNSHLGHMIHHKNFLPYIDDLCRIGKKILVIERYQEPVLSALQKKGVSCIVKGNMIYAGGRAKN